MGLTIPVCNQVCLRSGESEPGGVSGDTAGVEDPPGKEYVIADPDGARGSDRLAAGDVGAGGDVGTVGTPCELDSPPPPYASSSGWQPGRARTRALRSERKAYPLRDRG